jgi:hypothetical protein
MPETAHTDVAAYALGALDPAEDEAFRAHLEGCPTCRDELESMVAVTSLLSSVNHDEVLAAAQPPNPRMLEGALERVRGTRRSERRRVLLSAAAAAVLIVAGPVLVGTAFTDAPASPASPGAPAPPAGPAPAPTALAGTVVSAADPTTGVRARLGLQRKTWGTAVGLELRGVRGPQRCELVAVSEAGERQVVTTWSVPERGYGLPESPQPMMSTQGGAAFFPGQIDRFEVRTLDGRRLVSVPA